MSLSNLCRSLIFLGGISLAAASGSAAQAAIDLTGTWKGDLQLPGASLPIVLHIARGADGYEASMDSPAQGAHGIPVTDISLSGNAFSFSVPSIAGRYEGTIDAGSGEITGKWFQRGVVAPLNFHRTAAPGGGGTDPHPVMRPQMPTPPLPYVEEEIRFPSLEKSVTLRGTLTRPKGKGPFPAVVLITGSGPQDRDESLAGHKPFLIIADYLSRHGLAVLRYDDRGVGASGGNFQAATTYDFALDAAGALQALRARDDIDKQHVGYLGHSEGGVAAVLTHDRHRPADYLILLSTPVLPYPDYILDQVRALALAAGNSQATANARVAAQKAVVDAALTGKTPEESRAAVAQALIKLGMTPQMAESRAAVFSSPWMFSMIRLDPRPALKRVRIPLLGLWGEKDLQVDAVKHLNAAKIALADNSDADLRVLAGLNHLLQPARTGAVDEYGKIETTIAPMALDVISSFVAAASEY